MSLFFFFWKKSVQFSESYWTKGFNLWKKRFNSLKHIFQKGDNSLSHVEKRGQFCDYQEETILWDILFRCSILWFILNSLSRVVFLQKKWVTFKKKVLFFESYSTKRLNSLSHTQKKRFNSLSHVEKMVQFYESCSKEGSILWVI